MSNEIKFIDDKNLHFISREDEICYAVGTYPGYIYTRETYWSIYPGEFWILEDFWPGLKEVFPFSQVFVPRLLKFKKVDKYEY